MDIDEFLDRELSDLDLQTRRTEKDELGLPEFKEQFESSPLFDNIKASLGKGNLDQAEQYYVQLWHILMQQKLKWNTELYGQLSVLAKQFSSALNYAYNEVKKNADHINELISRAKASLAGSFASALIGVGSGVYRNVIVSFVPEGRPSVMREKPGKA